MKAFVTGGTEFIGQHVVCRLIERGINVFVMTPSSQSQEMAEVLGATAVPGDISDVAAMREGMRGSDLVFHMADWHPTGFADSELAEEINVSGTRKVLRLAAELGVPRIIYISTVAVFGDTHGEMVDETYFAGGPFLNEYDRTKWLAHYQVALPLIEKGASIIIVMPGAVYGPGDTGIVAGLMRWFYEGMPAVLGPETTITFTHGEDIAEGIILAAEKGNIGESYVLAGPAIPLGEMVDFWAHLTGRRAPGLRLPANWIRPFAPLVGLAEKVLSLPPFFNQEAIASLGATYSARSDKARSQLGWRTRPLQTGMLETFQWIAQTSHQTAPKKDSPRSQRWAGVALLTALILFAVWWLNGRRQK